MLSWLYTDLVWMVVDKEQFNSLLYFFQTGGRPQEELSVLEPSVGLFNLFLSEAPDNGQWKGGENRTSFETFRLTGEEGGAKFVRNI